MLARLLSWFFRGERASGNAPLDAAINRLLGLSALVTFFAGTALAVIGSALEVGPATAMSDFVAGGHTADILDAWTASGVTFVAWVYLMVDTLVLLPAYVTLGVTLALWLGRELGLDQSRRWLALLAKAALVLTLLVGLSDLLENATAMVVLSGGESAGKILAFADKAKLVLVPVAALALLGLAIVWYFDTLGKGEKGLLRTRSIDRTNLRMAAADIVWRTRYTIAMLALFALLTVASDQTRDVVVGLAQFRDDVPWYVVLLTFAITAAAILAFAYVTWMWPRLMLRARRQQEKPADGRAPHSEPVYLFARWWGRIIGTMPLFIVVWLCTSAIRDAVRVQAGWTAASLAFFAGGLLIIAAGRLWANHVAQCSDLKEYYDDPDGYANGFFGEIADDRYKLFGLRRAPIWVPLAALVGFAAIRGFSLYWSGTAAVTQTAPMTLAALTLAITFWTSALGYVALDALRKLIPWVLFLIVWAGVFGFMNWTDNHVVWTAASDGAPSIDQTGVRLWGMYLAQFAVASFVIVGLFGVFWRGWRWGGMACALGGTLLTFAIADTLLPRAHTQPPLQVPTVRPSLDKALTQWLAHVCVSTPECLAGKATQGIPVYFVSSEGGGIRAGYWTAIVLAELSRDPHFIGRTFSVSGVSGGAVGEAVWYACLNSKPVRPDEVQECVKKLGSTDLLTPMLSAWMFEDVLARFVPTVLCKTPGCGFLDRGTWFEATIERAVPALRAPITDQPATGQATPHLFLNSTWVETGERAIASDIFIDSPSFPTARDQVAKIAAPVALSTAAHNAARFPYANALGSVRRKLCKDGKCSSEAIGHLADGGYFDNSGANTTTDILRAVERCLIDERGDGPCSQPGASQSEGRKRLRWLRANLVPQAIMIKNGVHTPLAARQSEDEPCKPGSSDEVGKWDKDASAPRCAGRWKLFSNFAGPPITALNTGGTGANGRLSESRLEIEIKRIRRALRPTPLSPGAGEKQQEKAPVELPGDSALVAVAPFNLLEEQVLFPLGWYLSGRARHGMERQCGTQSYDQVHINGARPKPRCGTPQPPS